MTICLEALRLRSKADRQLLALKIMVVINHTDQSYFGPYRAVASIEVADQVSVSSDIPKNTTTSLH